ncbi:MULTISPECIES: sulfite exporter TauE/SafE family protein [unclassified Streptomyces]|uniref:sulfite exporter TauE/SafE family protein n=1 Tax=unclassified Streptomyces TaxID=2593676 RepID=UPI002DDAE904|nr:MULTISPECIES: sulfite exporter TauE/SafE family protein [unclassified Streptomyces]WSA96043.1 sulfite exporter TauE/SafE family protein [Streptomyces sp. NBC_01795]WSB80458.1 sulfite exporter TauE/SafE family protein [Streptomyces sp. NBC_01775]WSS11335.1 sulfite exporter TauE/SafE family protein [Streptomyces sp. NBC_01186]WSS40045.1 sulfite exporter TauE/SafE family protein [Streptomyces sp. NBC_01187]
MDIAALSIVAVAGLLSGTVNSIAGGGSLLLFPALLGVGLPPQAANVTNSVANWPGFAGQVYGFAEELKTQPRRRLVLLSVVTGISSAAGSALLLATSSASFDQVVPALVLFASLLLAGQKQVKKLTRNADPRASGRPRQNMVTLSLAMAAAGIYGGYFAGALGVIMLATLAMVTAEDLRRLNALKAALSLVNSTVTLLIFAAFGPVHWTVVAVAAPMALAGGYLGARLARWMHEEVLRWSVVTIGVSVSAVLLVT